MINILVFDDNKIQCDMIGELVRKCCDCERRVTTIYSRIDLMNYVEDGKKIDILISDIYLENETENGIDIARKILEFNRNIQIIYITGFVDYCVNVYETEHVYFLTKPVDVQMLTKAINKALIKIEELNKKVFLIKNAGEIIIVNINDIMYFESNKRKVRVVCRTKEYETYDTIANIIPQAGAEFVQCHQSFLVNMNYIKQLNNEEIILENNESIVVSQKKYSITKEKYLDYIEDMK